MIVHIDGKEIDVICENAQNVANKLALAGKLVDSGAVLASIQTVRALVTLIQQSGVTKDGKTG